MYDAGSAEAIAGVARKTPPGDGSLLLRLETSAGTHRKVQT
jgi:hypothetical protein